VPPGTPDAAMAQKGTGNKKKNFTSQLLNYISKNVSETQMRCVAAEMLREHHHFALKKRLPLFIPVQGQ
jgi:hypothetical protein